MMINVKKAIAIIIAVMVVAGVIFGCSSGAKVPGDSQGTPPGMEVGQERMAVPGGGEKFMEGGPGGGEKFMEGGPGRGEKFRGRGGPGGQYSAQQLTDVQIQEFLKWAKEEDPDRYQDLEDMKSANPRMFRQIVAEGLGHMEFVNTLKQKEPAKYQEIRQEMKLERDIRSLLKKYHEAQDEKTKKDLEKQVTDVLSQLFDIRTAHREEEIRELESKLNQLKQMMEKRKANKTSIVEQRLNQLTNRDKGMDW